MEDRMTPYRDRLDADFYSPQVSWTDKTVPELKNALRARGLPVTGSKEELVDRLTANEGDG